MANMDGLHPAIRAAWDRLFADPEAKRLGLYPVSAYRSPGDQAQLHAAAVRKYGSESAASKWVAPAWHSNHGPVLRDDGSRVSYGSDHGGKWGAAVDVGGAGVQAASGHWPPTFKRDTDALCARYGFRQVMQWEDWHFEPVPGFDYTEDDMNAEQDARLKNVEKLLDEVRSHIVTPDLGADENGKPVNLRWAVSVILRLVYKIAKKVGA